MLCVKDLPEDIQHMIREQVVNMRKAKKVLTIELQKDIKSHHLIYELLEIYEYTFSNKTENDYLNWLENDILGQLNDGIAMMDGLSDELLNVFPGKTMYEILMEIDYDRKHNPLLHMKTIKKYWRHLPPHKRFNLYNMNTKF
jgi:hypothetical protein